MSGDETVTARGNESDPGADASEDIRDQLRRTGAKATEWARRRDETILEAVRGGLPIHYAAYLAGVSEADYRQSLRSRRRCGQCGGPIGVTRKASAEYCGDACKQAAYRDRANAAVMSETVAALKAMKATGE